MLRSFVKTDKGVLTIQCNDWNGVAEIYFSRLPKLRLMQHIKNGSEKVSEGCPSEWDIIIDEEKHLNIRMYLIVEYMQCLIVIVFLEAQNNETIMR